MDSFELADKIMEKDRLKAPGEGEVTGGSFVFFVFDFKLKTWESAMLCPSYLCHPCSSPCQHLDSGLTSAPASLE